ncbi:MAG: hypothetical protein ACRC78_06840 [Planktothrix sp.]
MRTCFKLQVNPQWRESLPVISSGDIITVKPHLEILRDRLIEFIQNPDTLSRYLDYLGYSNRTPLPFTFPYQLGSQIFNCGLETRFISPRLHPVKIVPMGDRNTQVILASKQATIKGIPLDLVTKLFRPQGFTLLDLADWYPSLDVETEVIPLLTRLVTQGLLQVESA